MSRCLKKVRLLIRGGGGGGGGKLVDLGGGQERANIDN